MHLLKKKVSPISNTLMFVSVIIPIFNVEQYIEACVRSVAAQRFTDYEIIAVDDCGKDASMQVFSDTVDKLRIPAERVRIIRHEHNKGLSAARNTGIKASRGKFLYFLDSDDTLTPDCLELLVQHSRHNGKDVEMVVGDYCFEGPSYPSPHLEEKSAFLGGRRFLRAYCKRLIYPMAWNKLILRDFMMKNELFFEEGLIHEDTLWSFQILKYINSVALVHSVTYVYRVRQDSLQTDDDFTRHFKANVYIVGKIADIMFSSRRLKCNKYVYDFVEEEKQRHLRDCRISGHSELIRELYLMCRQKPHYKPLAALMLFGYHEGILRKIIKRDRHYAMSFERGLEYFMRLGS